MRIPGKVSTIGQGVIWLVAAMIIFLTYTCQNRNVSNDFLTYPVQKGEFEILVKSDGVIVDKEETVIKPPVLGWIWQFTILDIINDGDLVKKDDVLVVFDNSEVEKERINAMTELENQKAEYTKLLARQQDQKTQLEADLEKARLDLELKENQLKSIRFEAKIKQEQLKLEHYQVELRVKDLEKRIILQEKIAEEERKSQKLRIKQAEIRVSRAEEHLKKLTLKSPKNGRVVLKESWRGKPEKGKTVGIWEPLMGITSMQDLQLECLINEIDIKKVEEGLTAMIELESAPGKVFECEVSEVAKLAKEDKKSDGMKTFQVYIDIKDEDPIIRPGYTARVTIIKETIKNALYIPLESVFPLPEEDQDNAAVEPGEKKETGEKPAEPVDMTRAEEKGTPVKEEEGEGQHDNNDTVPEKDMIAYVLRNGTLEKTDIKVGLKNDDFIVVTSGLNEGDRVTLRDPEITLRKLGAEDNKSSRRTPGQRDETS